MSRNNDVYKVLVTKGNKAPIVKDKKVTDLLPGQVGVFDYHTNKSIDATSAPTVKDFYLAVGLDKDNDGITDDIMKSSGSHIQKRNVVGYANKAYQAPQDLLIELAGYTADCNTEYGVKLEIKNQEIYVLQGFNQFTETYVIKTGCCDPTDENCPEIDQNELTLRLFHEISINPNGFLTPFMVDAAATDLTKVLTVADVEKIILDNKTADEADKKKTKLFIQASTLKIRNFCDVNLGYFYPRQTHISVTKIEGFKCNGEVNVVKPIIYEQGSGYDVKQLEYYAKGFGEEGPYRLHSILGVAKQVHYNTDQNAKYNMLALTYDQFSLGGFLEYLHNEASVIAIPKDDSTTETGLVEIIEALGITETV